MYSVSGTLEISNIMTSNIRLYLYYDIIIGSTRFDTSKCRVPETEVDKDKVIKSRFLLFPTFVCCYFIKIKL